jgi:NAD(P) transhydrogenase subunit beta
VNSQLIEIFYIVAAILFVFGIKMLGSADTARRGNRLSAAGMLLAIVVAMLHAGLDYRWIMLGLVVGSLIGAIAARRVAMTEMPELVAIFNGFGGIASLLVGWAEFQRNPDVHWSTLLAIIVAILIGGVTFTGSMIAYGKLSGKVPTRPIMFGGQRIVNTGLILACLALGILFCMHGQHNILIAVIVVSLILGIMAVIPIGGGDMPVVISLLNSYSGLAACAAGFVILNNVLIVAGALVGASGLILTAIMCKAMNRSLGNVLFSGFGSASSSGGGGAEATGEVNPISAADAYYLLEAASSVLVVPGYGMAVAQAQHVVRELGDLLEANNCEVRYAIHPVAGRMPGHMNVLLAEANVPYEQLAEPGDVNPSMASVDVCMVIGANDVVNPAARDDEGSPIYGMPIIDVDRARTVIVLKRSMSSGFAGIQNPLFFCPNTRMLFGDAKASVGALVSEFKDA